MYADLPSSATAEMQTITELNLRLHSDRDPNSAIIYLCCLKLQIDFQKSQWP